jgi:hypothetical protein
MAQNAFQFDDLRQAVAQQCWDVTAEHAYEGASGSTC